MTDVPPRPPTPPGYPSAATVSKSATVSKKKKSNESSTTSHQQSQELVPYIQTFNGGGLASGIQTTLNANNVPVAGQVRADGGIVSTSMYATSADMRSDGIQHEQQWGYKIAGESGETGETKKWFVAAPKSAKKKKSRQYDSESESD